MLTDYKEMLPISIKLLSQIGSSYRKPIAIWLHYLALDILIMHSVGFRNLERVVQPLACKAQPKILGVPRPLSVT